MTGRVAAFVRLSRPVFLIGGALLYAVGAAIAAVDGHAIDWGRYLLGQALVTAVQLTTQYGNEYFDLETDKATTHRTWFSGGSGVLPSGALPPAVALRAATLTATVAVALAAVVVFVEPMAAIVAIVALVGGWLYSAPPVRLVASGVGELAASFIVAVLTPVAGALMQGRLLIAVWAAGTALFAVHVAMLLAFQMPDLEADATTGKGTLAVRVGRKKATMVHDVAFVAAGVWIALAGAASYINGAVLTLIALPTGLVQITALHGNRYHVATTAAVATFALLSTGLLLGSI